MDSTVRRLRGAVWRNEADVLAQHREEAPLVWEAVDALLELLGTPPEAPTLDRRHEG